MADLTRLAFVKNALGDLAVPDTSQLEPNALENELFKRLLASNTQVASDGTITSAGIVVTAPNVTNATGTLPVAHGGTGVATLTAHGVVVGEGTSAVAVTAAGTAGQSLVSGGAIADPAFGVAGVNGGGTGVATLAAHGVVVGEGTSAVAVTGAGTAGQPLVSGGASADPAFGTAGVNGGGTGVATLAAHGLVVGNGASAVNVTGAGTAGQVLTSNGASADPTFQDQTWTSVAYAGGNFTAVGGGSVTVDAGDQIVYQTLKIGRLALVNLVLNTITVTGTVTSIVIAGFGITAALQAEVVGLLFDNSNTILTTCRVLITAGGSITVFKLDGTAFAVATNNTYLRFMLLFPW